MTKCPGRTTRESPRNTLVCVQVRRVTTKATYNGECTNRIGPCVADMRRLPVAARPLCWRKTLTDALVYFRLSLAESNLCRGTGTIEKKKKKYFRSSPASGIQTGARPVSEAAHLLRDERQIRSVSLDLNERTKGFKCPVLVKCDLFADPPSISGRSLQRHKLNSSGNSDIDRAISKKKREAREEEGERLKKKKRIGSSHMRSDNKSVTK